MNINQIEHALDVAETRSINKSAANLYISPQGLSASIARLEAEVGITMFARTSKGMVPTDEGERFLALARSFLSEYRHFEHDVAALAMEGLSLEDESVSLYVPPMLTVSHMLPLVLDGIGAGLPGVAVDVSELNSLELVEFADSLAVSELAKSVMIANVPDYRLADYFHDRRYALANLAGITMVARVCEGHPLAGRSHITKSELSSQKLICFNEPVIKEVVHHMLDEYGDPKFVFSGSAPNLIRRFPDAVAIAGSEQSGRKTKGIVEIPIQDSVSVHIVAICANPPSPLIRRCIECVSDVFTEALL